MGPRQTLDVLQGEQLKSTVESALHNLALNSLGRKVIDRARGGERVYDPRLYTHVAGMMFENPIMAGAGWDKTGRAVDGLFLLGFAGTEVGSVLVFPQAGNDKPRLWTDKTRSVGLNRMGFNSPGMEAVAKNLDGQHRWGHTGISLGKNKLLPDAQAPWAHAAVAEHLHDFADYFVINVASPNTPGLRNLLDPAPLTDIVQAVKEAIASKGEKPLFVKTTVDLALEDLNKVLQVCDDQGVDGIIDTNTTVQEGIKIWYGWGGQAGGVSGNSGEYRFQANQRMRHITKETKGTKLQRIGVGAINSAGAALDRIAAGAQAIQVVTAIRQHGAKTARLINLGILAQMEHDGVKSIGEYVGVSV